LAGSFVRLSCSMFSSPCTQVRTMAYIWTK
jgi:hypothetical protein